MSSSRPAQSGDLARSAPAERSFVQQMDALQRASEIRMRRNDLKRAVKSGEVALRDVLWDPPDFVESAEVFDLLLAAPKFGQVRAARVLEVARLSRWKTVGELSQQQRLDLITLLSKEDVPPLPEARREVVNRFASELSRFFGDEEPHPDIVARAVRIAAAEQSWRLALGLVLEWDDVAQLLSLERRRLDELEADGDLIVLPREGREPGYPAFQFHDGLPNPALAQAHQLLVEIGRISPWSAAAWARARHPELDERTPAQWAAERRGDQRLLTVARRDAARLAQ